MIDPKIIVESKNGDYRSFRNLVLSSSPLVYSVAFRILCNEELAREIVQETMITVWKNLNKINAPERYIGWLYRITVNKCNDELRKAKRNPEFHADERIWNNIAGKIFENPSGDLDNREIALLIKSATEHLSPSQKSVFVLCELEGLSQAEVAVITSMSRKSVKANLYHARKKIGLWIEKYI
jgi:RNA polymerase sigma-70 factor (ECF subfamily)